MKLNFTIASFIALAVLARWLPVPFDFSFRYQPGVHRAIPAQEFFFWALVAAVLGLSVVKIWQRCLSAS